jgi:hypothetical protein
MVFNVTNIIKSETLISIQVSSSTGEHRNFAMSNKEKEKTRKTPGEQTAAMLPPAPQNSENENNREKSTTDSALQFSLGCHSVKSKK